MAPATTIDATLKLWETRSTFPTGKKRKVEYLKGLISVSTLALVVSPAVSFAQTTTQPGAQAQGTVQVQGPAAAPGTFGAPGAPPPADQAAAPAAPAKEEAPKELFWRGTSFTWTQGVSTTTVGIGRDNYGYEDDFYAWDFTLAPNFFLLDLPDDKITATVEAGVSVEWTDSAATTTEHEPQFRDTQVGLGYSRSIFKSEDKEWSTGAGLRLRYSIPTSKTSIGQGRYGVLSAGVSANQKFRLAGNDAVGFNNLTVSAGLTYSHLFSRAYTPTNPGLERTRTTASFAAITSDQLGTRSFDIDRLIPSVTFTLPLIKDLTLTTAFRMIGRWKHDFEDTCIVVMNECQPIARDENRPTYFTDSSFDVALSQPIYDMFAINVGYNNETLTLGEDGKNRNIFYSPSAQFYLDLTANIDVIYQKAAGEKIDTPPQPKGSVASTNEFGNAAF